MNQKYINLVIAILLTGILSLSTHVLILQYFPAPMLTINPTMHQLAEILIRFGMVAGALIIYVLSIHHWRKINIAYQIIGFALLLMVMTSTFRSFTMEYVCGMPIIYLVLSTIPTILSYSLISGMIILSVHWITRANQLAKLYYLFLAIGTTLLVIYVRKYAQEMLVSILESIPIAQSNLCQQLPYGMDVLIPAYLTFIEPTLAVFIVYYLIKDRLTTFSTLTKGVALSGIIIISYAGVYSIVQIIYSEGNILYRTFYYGQFLWEYLVLGLLTAYSVAYIERNNIAI